MKPTDEPPDFNYIPDYSNACLATGADHFTALRRVDLLSRGNVFLAAEKFEICSDHMTSKCAPCSWTKGEADYNAFGHMVSEFDSWGAQTYKAALAGMNKDTAGLEAYFTAALAYPWRQLLVHGSTVARDKIRLSPGQALPCELERMGGGASCVGPSYKLTVEGLDKQCETFRNEIPGSISVERDGTGRISKATVTSSAAGTEAFGFSVPIADPLPPVSRFKSTGALQLWLAKQLDVLVPISAPEVNVTTTADGTMCGRLTGLMPPEVFEQLAKDDAALTPYSDITGLIPVIFTLELGVVTTTIRGG